MDDYLWQELLDVGVYEVDAGGCVRQWSAGAERLFGYVAAEVLGRRAQDFAALPDPTPLLRSSPALLADGRVEAFGWAKRKDGSRFWASEVTVPVRHDAPAGDRAVVRIVRDVSVWKAAEEERDRVFTLSPDLIGVAGLDGRFKRVNPSFSRLLGYTDEEILSRPFLDFVHPDDVGSTAAEARLLAAGVETRVFRNRWRCMDGSYRWLEWNVLPIVGDGLMYAVARDVTEQNELSAKLEEYARELERSNEELQQFAYVASHDLQEPLRAVVGCVQLLGERIGDRLDDRSLELMQHAVDGAKRMQVLISDLLAYSRVGSKGIAKASIDTRSVVDRALKQLEVAITESGASIAISPLPRVYADTTQLVQLFQNLIGNAIKFRGTGDGKTVVTIGADAHPGVVEFFVQDNGIGIAPEYHDRIFGLFQRLHPRDQYAGTGIGLPICKKIVERHGGRIWIDSRLGEGATFRFTIPNENEP